MSGISSPRTLSSTNSVIPSHVLAVALAVALALAGASVVEGQPGRYVGTPSDPWIPNFAHPEVAGGAIVTSIQAGDWSDAATWGDSPPTAGDVVVIEHDVSFDVATEVYDLVIYPGGRLRFRTDLDTRLTVGTLQVLEGAALEIGRRQQPVADDVLAEIVFTDRPIDTAVDPGQYGNGLIVLGEATLHGAPVSTNFARLALEPAAGDLTLEVARPVLGWQPGGRVVVPDSRQADPRPEKGFVSQTETAEIAAVSPDGRTLTLAAPLAHAHPGARDVDGELDYLPHVAYLASNLVLLSENPGGTRGHAQFLHRADADVRFVLFRDLGRTTAEELDPTVFDEDGNATYIGTNQPGRYPLHAHHLTGPEIPQENGRQFTFGGNAIDGGEDEHLFKWGIAIHASHYGVVRGNTVYNYAGAGIVTEDGSESHNLFTHNFAVRSAAVDSLNTQDRGTAGTAFWFRGQNNVVRDNVAADARSSGFSINAYRLGEVEVPVAQGSLTKETVDMNALPILDFTGNESYGPAFHGLDLWEIGSTGETLHDVARSAIRDLTVWHHFDRGLTVYRTHRITYDRLTIRGDTPQLDSRYVDPVGVHLSDFYRLRSHVLTRVDIQGQRVGISIDLAPVPEDLVGNYFGLPAPQDRSADVVVQASRLSNYINVSVGTRRNLGSPRRTLVCDTEFGRVDIDLSGQDEPQYDLVRDYDFGLDRNVVSPDELLVYNYDLDPAADFDAFYLEQAPDFIVPQTTEDGRRVGSPEAGLTNEENWALYGIAIGGEIAPCLDGDGRPEVLGFACPIDGVDGTTDVAAPTAPPALITDASAAGDGEVRLAWLPSCDDDRIAEYVVERDGLEIARTSETRFVDAGLATGTYSYRVRAVDPAGHESVWSTAAVAEVQAELVPGFGRSPF